MLTRLVRRWSCCSAVATAVIASSVVHAGSESQSARVLVPQAGSSDDVFAVLMRADAAALPARGPSDHIVIVDTSASQVAGYRRTTLQFVKTLLESLPATDRVLLMASDVQLVALQDGFSAPGSESSRKAFAALEKRVPMGTSKLLTALREAVKQLPTDRRADILYLGDGQSTGEPISAGDLRPLIAELRSREVPVHGFAVGPSQNLHLFGTLAHQTGGYVGMDRVRDSEAASGEATAREVAAAMSRGVFYPEKLEAPGHLSDILPGPLPIRGDRETILLGRGRATEADQLQLIDQETGARLTWSLSGSEQHPAASFLSRFREQAAMDGGLSNSLAGWQLFCSADEEFQVRLSQMVAFAQEQLIAANPKEALRVANAVLQLDGNHRDARVIAGQAQRLAVRDTSFQPDAAPPEPAADLDGRAEPNPSRNLLDERRQLQQVRTEQLRVVVNNAIKEARSLDDTTIAIDQLRQVLNAVKSAADLAPEDRNALIKTLDSEVQATMNRRDQVDQSRIRRQQLQAQEEARIRLADELVVDEQRLENLIDRVRSLMIEGRHGDDNAFAEAEAVAKVAVDLRPLAGAPAAARFNAEAALQLRRAFRLRERRADQYLETLHQVELSHIPFPDEPPIRFPSAEVWKALTERRRKYKSVDLKRNSPNEERIMQELSEPTDLQFTGQTLQDAVTFIEDLHDIEIIIDETALNDEGIAPDTPVDLQISGISLRSALRLMLEPLQLTYVIQDEVMKITTQTAAEDILSTRVYPVADLVVPISSGSQGGLGGGIGGGIGGQGGIGGGGGFGGGGGGFGGMGGGGGFFSVPAQAVPADAGKKKPQ